MRRVVLVSMALLFGLSLVAGCSPAADKTEEKGKLSVYASFYPMYDFAQKVGGDRVEVHNMVPPGTEPHDWEPAPSDIANLEDADVFVYNGAGMEHWVDKVLASLGNKELVAVEASKGLALLEGHDEHEGEEEHAGEVEEEHEGEEHDPHVWLSPKNAKQEMANIKEALVKADPANKDYYEQNYQKYAAEFDALDKEFREALSPLPDKDIIVSHQAFGYLCADYGLNQVAIEGLSPDSEPDPARMAEIIDFTKEHQVKVIFFEELVSPKVAQAVADATAAETEVLNPLEGLNDEQQAAGEDYFSIMRQNLEVLKIALQ